MFCLQCICDFSSVLSHVPAQNFESGFNLSWNLKRGTARLAADNANAIHAREALNPGERSWDTLKDTTTRETHTLKIKCA
jgi:hypothetical protein